MTTLATGLGTHEDTVSPGPTAAARGVDLARAAAGPSALYAGDGRWSFGSGALLQVTLRRDGITVAAAGATPYTIAVGPDPLTQVGDVLAELAPPGWRAYGWVAFELAHLLHGDPADAGDAPLLHLLVPEREVRSGPDGTRVRATTPSGLAGLTAALRSGPIRPARPAPVPHAVEEVGGDAYRGAVASAVADIRAHRLVKVILSRTVPVPGPIDLAATYEAGLAGNTPARSFLIDVGGWAAAGFSPETVVEVGSDGRVSTQPLAGTRAHGADAAEDERLRAELLGDPKEVAEHAVSVRAACDELAGLCREDSVAVSEFMVVRERGSVQHLASRVAGALAPGRTAWHALGALFPAITASGVPKRAACASIRHHEGGPRGLYAGAVLTVDADGAMDAALALRTVFRHGGRTWMRAGAGVVAHSDPDREFEETCEKLRSVSRFLVPAPTEENGS